MYDAYLVVAGGLSDDVPKEEFFEMFKSRVAGLCSEREPVMRFDVPDGEQSLKFGTFDDLVRLTDDLQKYDSQVEGCLRRLERQVLEIDPMADFHIRSQRQWHPLPQYIRAWQWDDFKYPKSRSIQEHLTRLMSIVNMLDEESRSKAQQYNDLKTQTGALLKRDGGNLLTRDLIDVLMPEVVLSPAVNRDGISRPDPGEDFVETDHLTTVVVVLSKEAAADFDQWYERSTDYVVPRSARRLQVPEDKDGMTVWRVIMFKAAVEAFKKACRTHGNGRYTVRDDFKYSRSTWEKLKQQREALEEDIKETHKVLKASCQAHWSDVMIAWMHLKAMRVFVEGVLRFGVPPLFASFIISPKPGQAQALRKILADVLVKQPRPVGQASDVVEAEGDEYYPYVSITLTPLAVQRELQPLE